MLLFVLALCSYLFSYCELKLVTCVNAEIALVNFTIFVQTMGVTVSKVFRNDFLIVSFRSSVQQSTRFIVWTLPTIVLLKIKENLDIYQLLTFQSYICVHVYELDFNVLTDLDIQYQHLSVIKNKHSSKSFKVTFVFISTIPQKYDK